MMNLTGSPDTANERWPLGNLGGNAGKFSSHWGWRAYFFTVLHLNALVNLGGTARNLERSSPQRGSFSTLFIKES